MRSLRWLALLPVAITLVWCADARAAAGERDPSFSGDGRVALPAAGSFVARAVAVDASDRILVAGYACEPDAASRDATCLADGNSSFRLARLTRDGGLDPEFGANGFVTTRAGDGRSQALDVQLLPDGSIVAGGVATSNGTDVFALVKYSSEGAVDQSFGANGQVLRRIGSDYAAVADLALGPNATIIAAGQAVDDAGAPRMAVARFAPNGTLDATFGSGGSTLGGAAPYGYGLGVAAWGDGSSIAGGIAGDSSAAATYRFGALRLDAAGAPVDGFGNGGATEHRVGATSSFANAVIALPGGASMSGGVATLSDGRQAMAIARGTAVGTLDPNFGEGGARLIPIFEGAVANDLVALPDGRVVAVGHATQGGAFVFAQARLLPNGASDVTFGTGGLSAIEFERYPVARATAGALQSDGRLVSVGIGCDGGGTTTKCTGGTAVLLAARQLADAPFPPPTQQPPPDPDTTAPRLSVKHKRKRITRRVLRRRGVRLTVRASELCRVRATMTGRRPGRRKVRRLDRKTVRQPRAVHRIKLKGRSRRGRVRIRVRVTDAAGNAKSRKFTIRVR